MNCLKNVNDFLQVSNTGQVFSHGKFIRGEIRRTYVKGKHSEFNSYGLAKKYGVNPKTIQNIVNGKSWKDVGA